MKLRILKDFEIGPIGNTTKMIKGNVVEWPTGDTRIHDWMAMHWVEAVGQDAEVT